MPCLETLLLLYCHMSLQNNIAEVQDLQSDLLDEDLLEHILSLMQDTRVDMEVRYFAGGILAQLASRPQAWTLSAELLSTIVEQLVRVFVWGFLRQMQTLGPHLWFFFSVFPACCNSNLDPDWEGNGLLQVRNELKTARGFIL